MPPKVDIIRSSHQDNFKSLFETWHREAEGKGYENIENNFCFEIQNGSTNYVCYITYVEPK